MSDNPEWQLEPQAEQPARKQSRRSAGLSTRTMADLLFLAERERSLMNWLVRHQQATVSEIAVHLNQSESAIEALLSELIAQGFIQKVEQANTCHYQPNLISRKGRSSVPKNIWDALE
ncbi:BlaI/MecI/CopY family transcriptional regulator [Leptolyngbya sp. GB1-A1]|uniref:helix-turn-helix domain-containing protein n=1 Tax=Leptolyngbya sp. GB1-A1 TaxID=2933908 RepID=UPI003298FB34